MSVPPAQALKDAGFSFGLSAVFLYLQGAAVRAAPSLVNNSASQRVLPPACCVPILRIKLRHCVLQCPHLLKLLNSLVLLARLAVVGVRAVLS